MHEFDGDVLGVGPRTSVTAYQQFAPAVEGLRQRQRRGENHILVFFKKSSFDFDAFARLLRQRIAQFLHQLLRPSLIPISALMQKWIEGAGKIFVLFTHYFFAWFCGSLLFRFRVGLPESTEKKLPNVIIMHLSALSSEPAN